MKRHYILGISCFYHDSAACLLRDGQLVAAAEEERFSRRKHDNGFPTKAIRYCLESAGIQPSDLDAVAFYEKPLRKFDRILTSIVEGFPRSRTLFTTAMPVWLKHRIHIAGTIRQRLGGYGGPLYFGEHHLSHAASAFLVSPYNEAAILTMDGVGEWDSATLGTGHDRHVELTHEIRFPHSVGLLYSAFTAHLGFEVNEGEYKVMGMAPYGKPTYIDRLSEIVDVRPDGSFELDTSYFAYQYGLTPVTQKFIDAFGPARQPEGPIEKRHLDIAASVQRVIEEIVLNCARHLHETTGLTRMVMAGGVALNCVANGRVIRETPMKELWVQPAAGDSGGCIGVATWVWNSVLEQPRSYQMDHAYLGPAYSGDEIARFLRANDIAHEVLPEEVLVARVADLLSRDSVVGWFQGRMEFGPRALGNRSILANPTRPDMRDIVNMKIKHREQFRPFAPAVTAEAASEYFDLDVPSPYMLLVAPVRSARRSLLPAVTHVDGSARVQTVSESQNPRFHRLISQFQRLTGVPVLLNTSFNVRGEPIVNTPQEAFNSFAHTDMDYLVLGDCLIAKEAKKQMAPYPGRKQTDEHELVF